MFSFYQEEKNILSTQDREVRPRENCTNKPSWANLPSASLYTLGTFSQRLHFVQLKLLGPTPLGSSFSCEERLPHTYKSKIFMILSVCRPSVFCQLNSPAQLESLRVGKSWTPPTMYPLSTQRDSVNTSDVYMPFLFYTYSISICSLFCISFFPLNGPPWRSFQIPSQTVASLLLIGTEYFFAKMYQTYLSNSPMDSGCFQMSGHYRRCCGGHPWTQVT